jgi:predicted HicB family RNase H-like nuclease
MPKQPTYTLGTDVAEDEVLRDRQGRVVDDAYAEAATEEALAVARRRGRPSLSRSGESPLLRVRLSQELDRAVTHAAEQAGISRSDWVRRALAQAARKAS